MRYARRGDGFIWRSESSDNARSFSRPVATNLRNPHAGIEIATGRSGRLLIAFNDSHMLRTPLTLGISEDEGQSFRTRDVEAGNGEFSYPKLIQTGDGRWHLFYTHLRLAIAHVAFDEDWLLGGRKEIGL
jgi:predicted neuraminidase